jgi:protein-disulfide isomerase
LPVVVYSDFKCAYCFTAASIVEELKETYGEQIHVDFRQFPLSFNQGSEIASEASECARDQGRFWEYHDLLFAYSKRGVDIGRQSILEDMAKELEIDIVDCLRSKAKKPVVDADIAMAKRQGVTGTPTFFIGREKIVGAQPTETFKKAIEANLEGE